MVIIGLEEFAGRSGVKVSTLKKSWMSIPGIAKTAEGFVVEEGTRYPYSMRGKTTKPSSAKKRFYILDAIYHEKYIDPTILRCEPVDFSIYVSELIEQGFIQHRECKNQHGTNGYITTTRGDDVFAKRASEAFEEYSRLAGIFAGNLISEILPQ